ncbi:ribonuclease Z [Sporosarcina thermotolerans]|uniref:Ribonuclease Z n=1 Tax=Sporosarcina thermotolerans TaxID=633404 RepID=A0AAW9ABA5_9BACL|nr:ribonuclease Z [Sporosarcina thermotolerans]MDW0117280.1 ribonuclease Z [Sporosarcina thermotolerans]WHT47440.1 ribonuclease Z [Sporosarcina thermotolerans]
MEIFFLGTGAGMPSKIRNTSSLILNLSAEQEGYWMFDCGEATQHQLLRTSIKPRKINKIFITHLHGDHIFGLPGFLGSRSFLGGEEELTIYGPVGIKEWVITSLRITKTHLTYPLTINEIDSSILFEDDQFKVTTKELEHVIECFGFRIEQKSLPGKLLIEKAVEAGVPKGPLLKRLKDGEDVQLDNGQYVYSKDVTGDPQKGFIVTILGDTRYCEASLELAMDADILVHEATFDSETGELAKEYGHSTIADAARTAKATNVKALIANHISARFMPSDLAKLKEQGSTIFPNLFIAEDFSHFEWKDEQLMKK